jgi:signal transduction histidine kinase
VYCYAATMGMHASIQNVFYFTLLVPLLLFHTSEWRMVLFCVAQPILLWTLLLTKAGWFFPPTPVSPAALAFISPAISVTAGLLIFGCCCYVFTGFQQNELNLVAARHAAEASSKAKDDFLATISHEIRTPMNGILGMLELVMRSEAGTRQADNLRVMKTSGDLLMTILNDILDFSRLHSGRIVLESKPFDLSEVVRSGMRLIEPDAHTKGLALDFGIAEGCPRRVTGDVMRFTQVVLNLLNNAVKFTPSGSISATLEKSGEADGKVEITLAIRDTGIGISREGMDKLFQAFSQIDSSTTRKYGGTGLGLAICKALAKMMDGDIRVTSEPGKGSDFRFSARFLPDEAG